MKPKTRTAVVVTVGAAFLGVAIDTKGSPDGQDHQAPPINGISFVNTTTTSAESYSFPNDMITGNELGAFPTSKRDMFIFRRG